MEEITRSWDVAIHGIRGLICMTQQKLGDVKIAATSSPPHEAPVKVRIVERRRVMGDEKFDDVKVAVCHGSEQRCGA